MSGIEVSLIIVAVVGLNVAPSIIYQRRHGPNPEVAGVRWVHLDHLLHPDTYHSARLEIRGEPRDFPAYRLDESIVWGMTERILTELLGRMRT